MFDFLKPVPSISADEAMKLLQANESIVFLDVRTPEEYAKGHIAQSLHIPIDDVAKKVSVVIPEKKQKIVVYCLSGSRSTFAVQEMMKMGYTQVLTLTSGLLGWRAKQYPLTTVQK